MSLLDASSSSTVQAYYKVFDLHLNNYFKFVEWAIFYHITQL